MDILLDDVVMFPTMIIENINRKKNITHRILLAVYMYVNINKVVKITKAGAETDKG